MDQVEDLPEGRKSALRTGGGGVMEALRNSPVVRPPQKLQRLAPGSPYPAGDEIMNDPGIVADVSSGPVRPLLSPRVSGNGGSRDSGGVAGVPVLPAFGGAAGGASQTTSLG